MSNPPSLKRKVRLKSCAHVSIDAGYVETQVQLACVPSKHSLTLNVLINRLNVGVIKGRL